MAIQLEPATIFNNLLHDLAPYFVSGKSVSSIEFARTCREVESLANADPSGRLELLGQIEGLRGNVDEAFSSYDRALKISDDYAGTIVRYMQLAGRLGEPTKVRSIWNEHKVAIQDNITALREAKAIMGFSGLLAAHDAIDAQLAHIGAGEKKPDHLDQKGKGLQEKLISQPIGYLHKFLIGRNARATEYRISSIQNEDDSITVLFQFGVPGTPEEVANLEWDLYGALSEKGFEAEEDGRVRIVLTTLRGS